MRPLYSNIKLYEALKEIYELKRKIKLQINGIGINNCCIILFEEKNLKLNNLKFEN